MEIFIPQRGSEKRLKGDLISSRDSRAVLARALIEPDVKKGIFRFSLPELGISFREGRVAQYLIEKHNELKGGEVWGVFTLAYSNDDKDAYIEIVDYNLHSRLM